MKKDNIKRTKRDTWKHPKSGKWTRINPTMWQKCCDCGLIHRWEFTLEKVKGNTYDLYTRWFREKIKKP